MHQPVVGDNRIKGLARRFIKFSESWLIKTIVKPVVFLLPPTLLTAAATRQGMAEDLQQYLPSAIANFINESALLILIGTYVYIVILKSTYTLIRDYSKPSRELSVTDILAINKALEIVVTDKYKRMSDEAKTASRLGSICPSTTFAKITKPEQQIALLTASIKRVFEHLDETNAVFRVGLLRIRNSKPTDWVAFEPISNPPRTTPQQLSAPSSTVSIAIKRKSIVIVEDIRNELSIPNKDKRRFLEGNTLQTDQGSQLCYPIVHASSGKIEYVITIAGNRKSCLIAKHADLYTWILEQFALRIALEHSLFILKDKADAPRKAA